MSGAPPAEQLAAAVARLAKSPMVAMSGHAGTLKLLVDYLADQQRRIKGLEESADRWRGHARALARVILDKHYGRDDMTGEQWEALDQMAEGRNG